MLVALPHHRECTNLHQSAYLDQNRYRARYPHHLQNIPHWEELYANTYIRPAEFMISAGLVPEVLPVGEGGVPGGGGVSSGIRSLRRVGGGAPVPLRVQRVCGFFVVPFWQGRQPDFWF